MAIRKLLMLAIPAMALLFVACAPTNNSDKQADFIKISEGDYRYLSHSDGRAYIPIGYNFCWPPFEWDSNDEARTLNSIDEQLRILSENGGNFARIWLSCAFLESETAPGVYDENRAKRLDALVKSAEKYGIRLKMTFEHFRRFTGKTPSHGVAGKTYCKEIYAKKNGGPFEKTEEFFTSKEGRELFEKRLQFYSNRYKDNPIIIGWELWNEVEWVDDVPLEIIIDWTLHMLPKLKKYFPKQLALQSYGSFVNPASAENFKKFYSLPGNEISQIHRYHLPNWKKWPVMSGPLDIMCADAIRQVLAFDTKRPVLLAEVGVAQKGFAGRSKLHDLDKEGIILHDTLFSTYFSGSAGPAHIWYWDVYVQKLNLYWHYKRFADSIANIDPIVENFEPAYSESDNLRVYALKGKKHNLIWIRDASSDMHSELEKNIPAKVLKDKFVETGLKKDSPVEFFDPWKNELTKGKVGEGGKVLLPEFKRSIVLRIAPKL